MKKPFSCGLDETVSYLGWLDHFLEAYSDMSASPDSIRESLRAEAKELAKRTEDTAGIPMDLSDGISITNVAALWGLRDFTFFCLLLTVAPEMDERYLDIYGTIQSSGDNRNFVTVGLAENLYSLMADGDELLEARREESYLSHCPLFTVTKDENSALCDRLSVNRQLARLLKGDTALSFELSQIVREDVGVDSASLVNIIEHERIVNYLGKRLDTEEDTLVCISGEKGSGRKQLVLHALGSDNGVLFIDYHRLMHLDKDDFWQLRNQIIARCVIMGFTPVITDTDEATKEELEMFVDYFFRHVSLVFVLSEKDTGIDTFSNECDVYNVSLDMPKALYRSFIWTEELSYHKVDDEIDIKELAAKYHLYPGKIKKCVETAAAIAAANKSDCITSQILTDAILSHTTGRLEELGERIPLKFSWDDLYIEESQKAVMKTLISRIKSRSVVDEEWGFEDKVPYGKGISMILYGSPGTGKTMAAQIMAKEIGMALYRIDLSRLVDKYIGETEKNISKVFDAASDGNVILFFDEADALFATRTEVNSSNDKHANTEIAFLLQKMEAHDGVTFLATNRFNNFDKAFLRRITYAARLERPDEAARLMLYNKILPDSTPRDKGLDFKFFSKEFELSGSEIKEILYSAASMAAGDGVPLSNKHMVRAIRYQQEKTGNLIPPETFGRYSSLVIGG